MRKRQITIELDNALAALKAPHRKITDIALAKKREYGGYVLLVEVEEPSAEELSTIEVYNVVPGDRSSLREFPSLPEEK